MASSVELPDASRSERVLLHQIARGEAALTRDLRLAVVACIVALGASVALLATSMARTEIAWGLLGLLCGLAIAPFGMAALAVYIQRAAGRLLRRMRETSCYSTNDRR